MADQYVFGFYWLIFLPALIFIFLVYFGSYFRNNGRHQYSNTYDHNDLETFPRSYQMFGHLLEILINGNHLVQWMAEVVNNSPSSTFFLRLPLCSPQIVTSNPANVQHILKTRFDIYHKPRHFRLIFLDLFRQNFFLADGQDWRNFRHSFSHEVNSRKFHKLVRLVTEHEVSNRLIPLLSLAAVSNTIIDFQDIIRRLTFDIVLRIGLGHDLAYLSNSPHLPLTRFADSFESSVHISLKRLLSPLWKVKRFFNVGSEKRLRIDIYEMREFLREIIRRKNEARLFVSSDDHDYISGLMNREDQEDIEMLIDTSLNFILGGVETVFTALIWYFWSVSKNSNVEDIIVKEVREKNDIRDMIYTHASIFESLRLHPPLYVVAREAIEDDVFPDGTKVKKGATIFYHTYAMGRSSELWGSDWPEFHPERWLMMKKDDENGGEFMNFVAKDSFTYPVFHGGPRICLGKEIALLQIKTVVAEVLRRFHIVPAMEKHHEPVFLSRSSTKMAYGFLVKVVDRKRQQA